MRRATPCRGRSSSRCISHPPAADTSPPSRPDRPGDPEMKFRRPRAAPGSPGPRLVAAPAGPAAIFPSAGALNNCGPPRWTETWERSVPSGDGPQCCRSRSSRATRSCFSVRPAGSDGCQLNSRGDTPAGTPAPPSATPVLGGDGNGQLLPPLLAATGQHRAAPAGCHAGTKTMLVYALPVARPIRRFHPGDSSIEPCKLPAQLPFGQG